MKSILIGCAALFCLCGCSKPQKKAVQYPDLVEGQVFIVGNSGQSIKLGALRVVAIPEPQARAAMKQSMELHGASIERGLKFIEETRKNNLDAMRLGGSVPEYERDYINLERDSLGKSVLMVLAEMADAKIVGEARTDADGRFKLFANGAGQKFYIIVLMRRNIEGEERELGWLVWNWNGVDELILSDHNTLRPQELLMVARLPW